MNAVITGFYRGMKNGAFRETPVQYPVAYDLQGFAGNPRIYDSDPMKEFISP